MSDMDRSCTVKKSSSLKEDDDDDEEKEKEEEKDCCSKPAMIELSTTLHRAFSK
jgi:hypothetical protein